MRWWGVLLACTLSGCALMPPAPASAMRPAQPESAPFALNGRISVSHQGTRHSAGLRWTHTAQADEVLLLAPLGQTSWSRGAALGYQAHQYCPAIIEEE